MGENIDLRELLSTYTKHWIWFVLCTALALGSGMFYLRYTIPEYNASAKIQIVEENSGGGLALFKDMDLFSGAKNNVLDEMEIMKSHSNIVEVIKELKLNIQINVIGDVISSEIYENKPVNINFIATDSIINQSEYDFFIKIKNTTTFGYAEFEEDSFEDLAFGNKVSTLIGDLVLVPNIEKLDKYIGKVLHITITPVDLVADYFKFGISISNQDDKSNIVNLSLNDAKPRKAQQILNSLIKIYNNNAIEDKKEIADRTSKFINERINDISSSLTSVDQSAETLRTNRGITDIAQETNINLSAGASNRQSLANVQNELNIAASMKDIIDQQEGHQVLPANIGVSDPTIASTTSKYNQLVQERNRLLKSSNEKNPVIVNLDEQLNGLRQTMRASLNSTVNNLGLTVNTLSGQQAIINSRIYSAPKNERALRDITRQQQTTESLYLYLLEKREESQIGAVSTAPKCRVIDWAKVSRGPVAPRRKVVLLAFILLGLLVPFSIIYLRDLLDNKVHNIKSLEKVTKNRAPVIGELPKISKKEMKSITTDDRSVLSEALRIFRTNLDYLIKTKKNIIGNSNVIYVTSSVPGEGKTFVSSNLAMTLASTNKRVLLIGADIRNPKIYNFFKGDNIDRLSSNNIKDNKNGLTEYLLDDSVEIRDITKKMLVQNHEIDIIYSGKIPPNPAELLMSTKIKDLIDETAKDYDYIIVDTAPLMVVTDTLLIAEHASQIIYVTRAGYTEKKAVEYPLKLQEEGKLKNVSFVVNDVKNSNLGYGGKYGYGYGSVQKKWWKFYI